MFLALVCVLLSGCKSSNAGADKTEAEVKQSKSTHSGIEAENFVNRLDKLGYFKYTNPSDIDSLKKNMIDHYDPNNELSSTWGESTMAPKDYRYYLCDGEEVFEQGGIKELLEELRPTFHKLNFKCEINKDIEAWDEASQSLDHTITINGTDHVIFKKFKGTGWGEAPIRVAEILNMELARQGKDERIYLASGGNDGRLIFLTDALYQYIYSVYKNPDWKPLELKEWAHTMRVER